MISKTIAFIVFQSACTIHLTQPVALKQSVVYIFVNLIGAINRLMYAASYGKTLRNSNDSQTVRKPNCFFPQICLMTVATFVNMFLTVW